MTIKSVGLAAINSLNDMIIKGWVINIIEVLRLSAKRIQMPSRRRQDGPVKVSNDI
jgi:hypothetical protein